MKTGLELSLKVDELGEDPIQYDLEANAQDLKNLIERFGLVSLTYIKAFGEVTNKGNSQGVLITGKLTAELEQQCTISLKPVAEKVEEDFELLLVDTDMANRMDEDEAYLDEGAPDYDALEGDTIDVGEVIAQTLSISMVPYPRAEDAVIDVSKNVNVTIDEPELEKPNPFAELAKLKDKS